MTNSTVRKPLNPRLQEALDKELERQRWGLELIASENFTSPQVLACQGTVLTNKYAEGYPGRRYYGGCEYVDTPEQMAVDTAKDLFGADHANVQPHSGASANLAAYLAVMQPGDVLMGLKLAHGGHLTHGHKVSVTGKWFEAVQYGLDEETERIDYDRLRDLAREHKPRVIVSGASAYPRFIEFETITEIAREVDAIHMCDMAHIAGLIAAGVHPSPVPHCDIVTSTTHKTLRGPRGGLILCKEEHAKAVDKAVFPGLQGGPLMHVIAGKAQTFHEAGEPEFKEYAERVVANAKALAGSLTESGFRLVAGGTDNHLMLVDLTPKGVTGADAEEALEAAGITTNKNAIPNDPHPPAVTSGLRLGTPALTSRGMTTDEMERIGALIARVVDALGGGDVEAVQNEARGEVRDMCEAHPLYPDMG